MRVAVTGATGMIGSALLAALSARGDQAVALVRDANRARRALGDQIELHAWPNPKEEPPPAAALEGADAVVHLLGEPIAQRWTKEAKREIRDSRVLATRSLVMGVEALSPGRRPGILVSQSATGYYGPRGEEPVREDAAAGADFLAQVTSAWEHEALGAAALGGVRVVLTRTGMVLSPRGGALAKMLPPFQVGLGGPVAGGRQYVSWVHLDDMVGALLHCLRDPRAVGAVNVTAPNPVTNAELSRVLGRVLHRPALLPVPAAAPRLLFGEMATIVVTGQRVLPARLQKLGYRFSHPEAEPALRDVLSRA